MADFDKAAQQVAVQQGNGALQVAVLLDDAALQDVPQPILSFANNPIAQEAVLDSFYHARAHVSPYGESGKRVKQAAEYLKTRWKFTANERSLTRWVQNMITGHEKEERRLDNETGTEYDREVVEV